MRIAGRTFLGAVQLKFVIKACVAFVLHAYHQM